MPQEKSATTTTTTQTLEKQTQRVTSLEAKDGKTLSSLEEAVVRMHHGVSVRADARLPTNGVNDELMADLLQMEVRAFEMTGRIDSLEDVPVGAVVENERTKRIVQALQKKS
jgi:hypothetical protein